MARLVFRDTCEEAADTDLEAHTPTGKGTGWSNPLALGTLEIDSANDRITNKDTSSNLYNNDDDTDGTDMDAWGRFNLETTSEISFIASYDPPAIDGYGINVDDDGAGDLDFALIKVDLGAGTTLDTWLSTIADNATFKARLRLRSSDQRGYIDDTERLTATDASALTLGKRIALQVDTTTVAGVGWADDVHVLNPIVPDRTMRGQGL